MSFPKVPKYSRSQIDQAGKLLIDTSQNQNSIGLDWATKVLSEWRACHAYPINTFQATLRRKTKKIDKHSIVAQRLKRMPTIVRKLKLYPSMNLTTMQDIGGVRAVLATIQQVKELESWYINNKRLIHTLSNHKDYITNPKSSGYRSVHLIYKYKNIEVPEYNGLLLELQIRTKLQHAWATAVETMGSFLGQALKSSQGEKKWKDFFCLASCAFAYLEETTLIPGLESQSKTSVFKALSHMEKNLGVLTTMRGFTVAMNEINKKDRSSYYHLIILNSQKKTVSIQSFSKDQLEEATAQYAIAESSALENKEDPVLVSAGKLELLKRAYPNYFLDVKDFIEQVEKIKQQLE